MHASFPLKELPHRKDPVRTLLEKIILLPLYGTKQTIEMLQLNAQPQQQRIK